MLAMLPGGWSCSSVRFVSGAVAFCRAQVSVITTILLRGALGEVSYFDGSMGWFGRPETKRKKMRISGGLTTLHFQAA